MHFYMYVHYFVILVVSKFHFIDRFYCSDLHRYDFRKKTESATKRGFYKNKVMKVLIMHVLQKQATLLHSIRCIINLEKVQSQI